MSQSTVSFSLGVRILAVPAGPDTHTGWVVTEPKRLRLCSKVPGGVPQYKFGVFERGVISAGINLTVGYVELGMSSCPG